jgi:MoxR-like ATPase
VPIPAPQPAAPDDGIRAAILNAINITTPAAQPAAQPAAAPAPGTVDAFLAAQAAQQAAPTNAPAILAPNLLPDGTPGYDSQSEADQIAAALAETARTHPAAVQPATNAPATIAPAGREFARELFKDLPPAIVNAIPATLTVPVFNHPQAEKPSADYRWTAALLVPCLIAMASSPTQRVWFGGPAATGKTEMARQLAARTGRAIFRVNFDRYTEASGIVGDMGLVNGNTVWVDGPVAAACRHEGAVLLLDELTYGTPGAISCLNPVLERNGTPLRLPRTGETLPVPDSLLIIVADNTFGTGDSSGEYHARNEIGLDTRSRFQFKLLFDYLPVADERAILRASVYKETGRKPSAAALAPLMQILTVSRAQASQGELQGAPSLRGAVAFAALLAHGVAPAEAFAITVVNGAPAESHEALRQIFAAHWPTDATGALSAFSLFE